MPGTPNTILLEPANGFQLVRERLSGGAIIPGHLVAKNAADAFIVHPGAGLNAQKLFALPNVSNGGGIDQAYASGETVSALYAQPGDLIYGWVAASAAACIINSPLESAGDGTVRIATADAATDTAQRDAIVGYCAVAVDNSGNAAGPVRIQIEVA